jgi:hypothetical protein
LRILHRQRRESGKPARTLANLIGEGIVGLPGNFDRALCVMDGLDGGGIERQDHHLDPVLVHLPQPRVLDVKQAVAQILPDVRPEYL